MIPILILMFLAVLPPRLVTAGSESQGHLDLNLNINRRVDTLSTNPPLDLPLLAIQIGGIAGAYVISVAILLTLLLLVGRRLRRAVHESNYTLEMEMMKPGTKSYDPSPISPSRQNGFNRSKSHVSGNGSVTTIDESVVAAQRRKAQEEMERLYAAVMEHDEQRAAGIDASRSEIEVPSPDSMQSNPFTDRSSRISERPSMLQMKPPMSPPMSPPPETPRSSRLSKISSLSLFNSNSNSNSRPLSNNGKLRSPRFPLRKLAISSPISAPDVSASASYGDQMPLSPRLYNPPPPPPAPPASTSRVSSQVSLGKTSMRAPAPAPLSLSPAAHSSNSLPFRDAYPLQSAPATKTTILERPEKHMHGPRTGLPTPYSPYMPFTPVTPITPSRMVTKRQRRRETRENGLRVLNEDDVVKDDGDVWGY